MCDNFKEIDFSVAGNSVLEDFYYMLCDSADFGNINAEALRKQEVLSTAEKKLEETLTKEQKELYDAIGEPQSEYLSILMKQSFIYGYKVSLKMHI